MLREVLEGQWHGHKITSAMNLHTFYSIITCHCHADSQAQAIYRVSTITFKRDYHVSGNRKFRWEALVPSAFFHSEGAFLISEIPPSGSTHGRDILKAEVLDGNTKGF